MINQLYNLWQWLTTPAKAITDPEEQRRVWLFSTFLLILIGLLSILLVVLVVLIRLEMIDLAQDVGFPLLRETAAIFVVIILIYFLSRTRYSSLGIGLSAILISGRVLTAALFGQLYIYYLFAPVLVVLFFSLISTTMWTTVIATAELLLLVIIGLFAPDATFAIMIPMVFIYIVGSAFILAGVTHRDQQNSRIERQAQEMKGQNEALREINDELLAARKQAEEANRLKDQFLTTMSHELRTPLHAITGYSQILLEGFNGDLTPQQHQNQERIFENALALNRLVENIIEASRIEAGRMALKPMPFSLRDWVYNTAAPIKKQAQEKGLDFRVMIDERLPKTLVGDVNSLEQVIVHLLDNAVKFTKTGGVKLVLQRQGKNEWCIMVNDTGIGIPADAHDYIFEEFRQVDGSIRREHGGMGLGLAIVRNMVMIMEGQITVESEIDQGSTFTVTLPLIAGDGASPPIR